jgi:uroporphyrinogen-III synthase
MGAKRPQRLQVLVTRPAHDAAAWVQALCQHGFDAASLPLIDIVPLDAAPDRQAMEDAARQVSRYAALMFVSSNAVAGFLRANRALAQQIRALPAIDSVAGDEAPLARMRFLAPGPGTGAALLAAGVPKALIDAPAPDAPQFDSPALWQSIAQRDWRGCRVLIVRGRSPAASIAGDAPGRDWLTTRLREAGAQVEGLEVYERRATRWNAAQQALADASLHTPSVWLFSSSEGVAYWQGQPGGAMRNAGGLRAVATHPRIAQALRDAGWGVVTEARPALEDIVATLRSIESAHP